MKQYCRYCVYLSVNNFPYCIVKEKEISLSACKKANQCQDFEFADCEPEYQDALGETNGYHPRNPRIKKKKIDNISLFGE